MLFPVNKPLPADIAWKLSGGSDWPEFLQAAGQAGATVIYSHTRSTFGLEGDRFHQAVVQLPELDRSLTTLRDKIQDEFRERGHQLAAIRLVWFHDGRSHAWSTTAPWLFPLLGQVTYIYRDHGRDIDW